MIRNEAKLKESLITLSRVIDEQINDPGLWFDPDSAVEAYLQRALRLLHHEAEKVLHYSGGNDEARRLGIIPTNEIVKTK